MMRTADTVPEFPVRPHGPAELCGDPDRPPPGEGDRIRQLVRLGDALASALDANEPIHPALLRAAADLPAEAAALWTPDIPSGPLRLRLHGHRRGTALADRLDRWSGPPAPELSLRMLDRFCARVREVLSGERPLVSRECRCRRAGPERATAIEVVALDDVFHRAVVVQSDVTWRRQLQEELTHRVTHDELTGLPNRSALVDRRRVSIGVTVVERAPEGDDPVGTLLRDADTAMSYAKEHGRGRYEVFDSRMRWTHPIFGEVPPSTFIPLAERTGLIVQVGGWALRTALARMTDLEDRRSALAVNVSPRQLAAPGLVDLVDSALAASGLEPWRLTLEITEGALVEDPDQARSALTSLRRLGVTIALDDFGTGWSSMSYLRTLPVDVFKIDKTFVADLPRDPDPCAVVSAVLGLGHGLGLTVVAEGVEQEDQLDVLRDMGCDEYQSFIDGEPGPLFPAIETGTR